MVYLIVPWWVYLVVATNFAISFFLICQEASSDTMVYLIVPWWVHLGVATNFAISCFFVCQEARELLVAERQRSQEQDNRRTRGDNIQLNQLTNHQLQQLISEERHRVQQYPTATAAAAAINNNRERANLLDHRNYNQPSCVAPVNDVDRQRAF